MKQRPFYTAPQVAAILKRCVRDVRNSMGIPWVRSEAKGGHRRLPHADLVAYIKRCGYTMPLNWTTDREAPKGIPVDAVVMHEANHFWFCQRLLNPDMKGVGLTMRDAYNDLLSAEKGSDNGQ